MKWQHWFLLLPKLKIDSGSGSGFSQIFDSDSGSEWKTHNPAGVDSGRPNPDPVPPLKATFAVATYHNSLLNFLKLAWYSNFSKLSANHVNLLYLSGYVRRALLEKNQQRQARLCCKCGSSLWSISQTFAAFVAKWRSYVLLSKIKSKFVVSLKTIAMLLWKEVPCFESLLIAHC